LLYTLGLNLQGREILCNFLLFKKATGNFAPVSEEKTKNAFTLRQGGNWYFLKVPCGKHGHTSSLKTQKGQKIANYLPMLNMNWQH